MSHTRAGSADQRELDGIVKCLVSHMGSYTAGQEDDCISCPLTHSLSSVVNAALTVWRSIACPILLAHEFALVDISAACCENISRIKRSRWQVATKAWKEQGLRF